MDKLNHFKDIIIRDYNEEDYEEIVKLWEETGIWNRERDDTVETIKRTLDCGGKMLIMEDTSRKEIFGTSWMTFDGRRLMLHHFGILPEFQGRGLAKLLLEESLRFAKSKGYQVKLEVHFNNLKAINLYRKYGFVNLDGYNVYIIRDLSNF